MRKKKKCSFENALVEKSESSTRNKNGLVEGLLLFSTLQIGLKTFLGLKKLKILCRGYMLLMILMKKKLLELFTKKNCKKQIKKSLELKK